MLNWFKKEYKREKVVANIKPSFYPPIFIRGVSRSGGTLVVTLLDAHPDIAMSYELYPNLLTSAKTDQEDSKNAEYLSQHSKHTDSIEIFEGFEKILKNSKNNKSVLKKLNTEKMRNFRVFVARAVRAGIDYKLIAAVIKLHRESGRNINNTEEQLKFIENICLLKMNREKKSHWGLKCSNQFYDYLKIWPNAYFINVIRDGRDVLSSQLNTGSFSALPADVGRGWAETHLNFHNMVLDSNINAYELFYEQLVTEPEAEIKKLCKFLNISFNDNMMSFHKEDLSIYKKPAGHLSIERISKPIDSSKVGRWKNNLSEQQLEEFYSTAKDAMITFGYL